MTQPVRIQRKRTKGYSMQRASPNGLPVVSVTRPGPWGNPFTVKSELAESDIPLRYPGISPGQAKSDAAAQSAVSKFRDMLLDVNSHPVSPEIRARFQWMRNHLRELQGKNLACFCGTGPCHADVLLELLKPEQP